MAIFNSTSVPIPSDEVPRNLTLSPSDMQQRRFLSLEKWTCVPRPQYSSSCGMSAMCAVWNFLYSTLGQGSQPPISVEEIGEMLGFRPPLRKHGLFYYQTNTAVMEWFDRICRLKGVTGTARIMFKLCGSRRTDVSPDEAFWKVVRAVKSTSQAVIYHCESHFMTLVGYEVSPLRQTDAYSPCSSLPITDLEPWIISAETNGSKSPLHTIRWRDVVTDLSLLYPTYLDVRKAELGVREHRSDLYTRGEYAGRNLHCLILFDRETGI